MCFDTEYTRPNFFGSDSRLISRPISAETCKTLRACPNRIENRKRKSKSIRFRGECFGRCVQTESKCENRNAAENHGRAATYAPFKTMNTHAHNLTFDNMDPPEQLAYTRRHFDPGRSLGLQWRQWRARR